MSAAAQVRTGGRRRWLAPEVVQTSSMDCGPATLKCLLEGHHLPASYGRLREACQTDVDGTSIDTLEAVARQLGLDAEQVMIPADHVGLPGDAGEPLLAVVRHADTVTHFVVVWRRLGPWLQVMDPAGGRRWVHLGRFREELYRHEMAVGAADWREWAGSSEAEGALRQRMAALGMPAASADRAWQQAMGAAGWFALAALDASVRLVQSLALAGGVRRGAEAARMVGALVQYTLRRPHDIYAAVPAAYWSVVPDATNTDPTREMLRLRGAVMLRVHGRLAKAAAREGARASGHGAPAPSPASSVFKPSSLLREAQDSEAAPPPLAPELAAALQEPADKPMAAAWRLLRQGGRVAPLALLGAVAVATGAVLFEGLLFRGLFDISTQLALGSQRLAAAAALLLFLALLLMVEWPIVLEALRLGRHLETRLREALLRKLTRLHDRYFQSRPVSDMADRSHGIQFARGLPQLGLQGVQSLLELSLTVAALVFLEPASAGWVVALAAAALGLPLLAQPLMAERDMRLRNHAGALNGFFLDALLGIVPARVHRAERNVRRQHESLLVQWAQALRGWIALTLGMEAVHGLVCVGLAGMLLVRHFEALGGGNATAGIGAVSGTDLLLVFWTLKLPALGHRIAALAQQGAAQRNAMMRLLEPLGAPEEPTAADAATETAAGSPFAASSKRGLAIRIEGGQVVAGGHEILRDIDLAIAAGEHVAIVGPSGAGKSTVSVLLGWNRLASGRARIDGHLLGTHNVDALRRVTAWVDPGIQVWNRSLLDNLRYAARGDDAAGIGRVLDAARLRELAQRLPQGLQGLLGEGGALLSGGEGQRVRLARALLAEDTRLALLDEPFRGLDRGQRQALLREARQWWAEQTLLCVTHDVADTLEFHRVLVVEDGRIAEDGAPLELAAGDTRYRALLTAEDRVRKTIWRDPAWRRVELREGRLLEETARAGHLHAQGARA